MKLSGTVVKKEFLRGGVSVSIEPDSSPEVESPYFKAKQRGTFDLQGLSKDTGKEFTVGDTVTIEIKAVKRSDDVVIPPLEPAKEGTKGDFAYGDDAAGD